MMHSAKYREKQCYLRKEYSNTYLVDLFQKFLGR